MKNNLLKYSSSLRHSLRSNVARVGIGATAMAAPFLAFAGGGGGTPGAAIAGELAGGAADMGVIFAAVAVLIGLLLLWAYTKRAAK